MPGTSHAGRTAQPAGTRHRVARHHAHLAEEFFAVLPRELAEPVAQRLRKYVLRAKVRIEDARTDAAACSGCQRRRTGPAPHRVGRRSLLAGARRARALRSSAGDPARWDLWQMPPGSAAGVRRDQRSVRGADAQSRLVRRHRLRQGLLHRQEVIARAHYRGRVKRRLQRWLNSSGVALKPGDTARGPDGRALQRRARRGATGRAQEIARGGQLRGAGRKPPRKRAGHRSRERVEVSGPLPLPYSLPE